MTHYMVVMEVIFITLSQVLVEISLKISKVMVILMLFTWPVELNQKILTFIEIIKK